MHKRRGTNSKQYSKPSLPARESSEALSQVLIPMGKTLNNVQTSKLIFYFFKLNVRILSSYLHYAFAFAYNVLNLNNTKSCFVSKNTLKLINELNNENKKMNKMLVIFVCVFGFWNFNVNLVILIYFFLATDFRLGR